MSARKTALIATALCTAAALLPAAAAGAPAPAWALSLAPMPSNFAPGANPEPQYLISATNVGAKATFGPASVVKVTLPAGLTPSKAVAINTDPAKASEATCAPPVGQSISCETSEPIGPGRQLLVSIEVAVTAPEGTLFTEASVSGGGAALPTSTQLPTQVQKEPLEFDFLPGFSAPVTNEDGTPTTLAGSHPYQQTIAFALPTENPGDGLTNAGHARNISVELPRGLSGSPAATPLLCSEVQLSGAQGCPLASQVGMTDVTTLVGSVNTGISSTRLYNMVPPPGAVAELATDVADAGIFLHVLVGVRSDGDYGIEAASHDILALGTEPIFSVQAQVWGDPSSPAHNAIRGDCPPGEPEKCEVEPHETALLTLPGECPHQPLSFAVLADSWEKPAPGFPAREALYESADLNGNPIALEGCETLEFEPTIAVGPTTNLTDSPSGLNVTLHQRQEERRPDPLQGRAPAPLKDAVIKFPAGLAVNPSQASGLGACSEDQIGFNGEKAGTLLFSKAPQSCPEAAKIGTLSVTSPALVARTPDHEVEKDAEGNPVLEVLKGSIYIANPFANPFDSLIAAYLVIEDEKTGIVAKLAGKGELDPTSGRLTTRFRENPELPIQDIRAHLFGGPRGAFITPPTCTPATTETELTPWSAPQGKEAFPTASFQSAATPVGGPCPTSEAQLPNAPKLAAGTLSPSAGKYSPLVFKVSRQDGTQRLGRIEATLPTGVSAKLAGLATCSEADIAKARSREVPQMGALEQADPSCPAASQIGIVNAAAGAGPTPYYTQGHAYLAGPYKGAPISIVAIAPAVAGPFDLGTVVVRSAVYLDPTTAQGRVVSDPLPQILQGIPLDVRSVAVRAERPGFTLNPTSCAVKSFGGSLVSALGAPVPISERFQVGGCKSLPYKPKLSVRLFGPTHRGGHPRLKSVFTAKPGEANTAAISFALPSSEFIDQAHFRTICTRVQFAADQCPAGSVYGQVRAISPLLDYPLQGPIYLRSSTHKLPDVVFALRGPASQPIAFDVAGRVDSVNGGLRVRFETVPDAPLSKAVVTMQGAKKGLFQNSTNICKGTHRATVKLDAQSGKVHDTRPKLVAQCGKGAKGAKGGGSH